MTSADADRVTVGATAAELLRKLRARSLSSWSHRQRIPAIRSALDELARLGTAEFGGAAAPVVPDDGAHALTDQLQVLIIFAIRAGVPADRIDRIAVDLAQELGVQI